MNRKPSNLGANNLSSSEESELDPTTSFLSFEEYEEHPPFGREQREELRSAGAEVNAAVVDAASTDATKVHEAFTPLAISLSTHGERARESERARERERETALRRKTDQTRRAPPDPTRIFASLLLL